MQRKNLTYRDKIKIFLNFLKENNALYTYKKDVLKYNKSKKNSTNLYEQINPFVNKKLFSENAFDGGFRGLIIGAFPWGYTNEGTDFWSKLHTKWVITVDNLKCD
jgi:hypothetical protein